MNTSVRSLISAFAFGGLLALAGCGGGTGDSPNSGKTFNNSNGGAGNTGGTTATVPAPVVPPPPVANAPSLVITLANTATGAATNAVPAIARAIVRDSAGAAVPNAVVSFSVASPTLATIVPASGTALTDATGTAAVQVNATSFNSQGATTLTASSTVGSSSVSGSIGFAIGATTVSVTTPAFGINPLAAFDTTSVSVTVTSAGAPVAQQQVSFSSICATSGKAVLTSSVVTGANGVATASYRDNGCGASDTITAAVSGLASASGTLNITVPVAGSIQFVSASPTNITIRGTGGTGLQETSQVRFRLVDTGGNPLSTSQTVTFSLSTSVGGLAFSNGLTTSTATSDPSTGEAVVTVQSGTVATPVRVRATTTTPSGTVLSTQSDQLTVTTGIPDQASMSVSASTINIEGLDFDGVTTTITARLADHFSTLVPDNTRVNFVAEGGSIQGGCLTTGGACSVTMTSQALRPTNGRVTVLAFAVGEESFTDLNGDGLANSAGELVDHNGVATDIPEAFLDSNENGVRDANETPFDFNLNGVYDGPDGKYNGVLCTPGAATCSTQTSVHIFRNVPIIFSGSDAFFAFNERTGGAIVALDPTVGITFAPCDPLVAFTPQTRNVLVTIVDENGNAMPAGTSVSFSLNNGSIVSPLTSFVVGNTAACLTGSPGCPASAAVAVGDKNLTYELQIKTAATQSVGPPATCNVPSTSPGLFTVTVRTPKGTTTTTSFPVTN